jgi:hypothetical protein
MFQIQIRPTLDSAIESLLYVGDVLRMYPLDYKVDCWLKSWVVSHNSVRFL